MNCQACGTALFYAKDGKAGDCAAVTCRTSGCYGNRDAAPTLPIVLRCFGAQPGQCANRIEVLIDLPVQPANLAPIMEQINRSADMELALRKVCDDGVATLRAFWERLPHAERARSEAILAEARALLAKLEESRRR